MRKIAALFLLISILVLTLSGCAPDKREETFYGYFDTQVTVFDYSRQSEKKFNEKTAIVVEYLDKYNELLDIYNEYEGVTNLKTVNDAAGQTVSISRELFDFLSYGKEAYYLSGGQMNIAMGAVLSLWHDAREAGSYVPSNEALSDAAMHIDIEKMVLDEQGCTVTLLDERMSLDVGALGKGYVAGVIAKEMADKGIKSFVLNLGGNVTAIGSKPDGGSWRTGVENPYGGYFALFDLNNRTVSTSGDYHIIDKDTLMPAEGFISVTVVSEEPAIADALSTALFCMTYEEGVIIANALSVRVLWVKTDGTVLSNVDGFFDITE